MVGSGHDAVAGVAGWAEVSARVVIVGVVSFLAGAVALDLLYQWLEERKR